MTMWANVMLIAVTGVIGVGKSTLVEGLTAELGATPFYEPLPETENFMLEGYYKDPARYAYSMQTLLLALRFRAQQEAQWRSTRGEVCIMDSSIYSDKAFLEVQRQCGYIDDLEYRAYDRLCEIHFGFLQYPDLLIHLDLPVDKEEERIAKRSRACESGIPRDYLDRLHAAYDDLIPFLRQKFPVVVIDASVGPAEVRERALSLIRARQNELAAQNSVWPAYKKGF